MNKHSLLTYYELDTGLGATDVLVHALAELNFSRKYINKHTKQEKCHIVHMGNLNKVAVKSDWESYFLKSAGKFSHER